MEAIGRPVTPAGDWQDETRDVEIPGKVDASGNRCVVRIRMLPAAEVYLLQGSGERAELREIYRRWAEQAIVAPAFSFNGVGGGISWDSLPFATHEALARQIMEFSLEGTPAAEAARDAFRRGEPARKDVRRAGRGSRGVGEDGAGEPAAPAPGTQAPADSGAEVRP